MSEYSASIIKSTKNRQQGFTLIEAMIVVVIVALLAAIGIPSFRDSVEKGKARDASAAVATFLSQAKSEAVLRDQDMFVDIIPGANWCLGFIPDPDGATECNCADSPAASCLANVAGTDVVQVLSSADYPNVSITGPVSTSFRSLRGTADNGTVKVSSGNWGLHVIISSFGRIRVCAPADEAYQGVTGFEPC